MADTRNWLQRFWDQTFFGAQYTLHFTLEEAQEALGRIATPKMGWRKRDLCSKLESAINGAVTIGDQRIVTETFDTSDVIIIQDAMGWDKEILRKHCSDVSQTDGFSTSHRNPNLSSG